MAEENETDEPQEEDDETSSAAIDTVQDSLALTRTKTAYQPEGKRFSEGLKEKRSPQRVITANMNQMDPFTEDDIDDDTVIAPGKQLIGTAYSETAKVKTQPKYKSVAESAGGDDTLSLQSSDSRTAQTISFKVKGIQWRAGFSDDFTNTPLGHAIHPLALPGVKEELPESLKKTGVVIRPVNPRLRVVLNQLLPPQFRKLVSQNRKGADKMKILSIFFLPGTPSSFVGFIHEFMVPKTGKKFYLYIQTSVGKAPVAILDEVLKTLEAGLTEGEKASDLDEYENLDSQDDLPEVEFDLAGEVQQAMKQAGDTINDSIFVYGMRQANTIFRDWSLELIRVVDKGMARGIRMATALVIVLANSPLIRALASMVQFCSTIVVRIVWAFNKVLLGIARSPITKAIVENIVRVFKICGRLIYLIGLGIKGVFQAIGASFSFMGGFVKDPKNAFSSVSVEFPSFGKNIFGDSGLKKDKTANIKKDVAGKTGKLGVTAAKNTSRQRALPPPKPIKKGQGLPGPPSPAKLPAAMDTSAATSAAAKEKAAQKARDLGYFEDQAF